MPAQTFNELMKCLLRSDSRQEWKQIHLRGSGAVSELEDKLRKHYGMRHALCVSSATMGLHALALALGMKRSEFITTPYTYGATPASWLSLGNRPVFADIEPRTLTLNVDSVRRCVSSRTKALLAVDIFGNPSDTSSLRRIADEFGIWYIADAAQSLGASRLGIPASSMSDALVVSFTTGKTVFAGEGGAVVTNNGDLYQKLVWHTQHPLRQRKDLGLNLSNEFSLNARIHPLAAILANAGFHDSLRKSKANGKRCLAITEALDSIGLTQPIKFREHGIESGFFRLTAAWRNKPHCSDLLKDMKASGYDLDMTPSPVHLIYQQAAFLAAFKNKMQSKPCCPEAERQQGSRICLVKNHRMKSKDKSGGTDYEHSLDAVAG